MNRNGKLRIGADVGGTFTDIVLMDGDGAVWTRKVPSTPPNYEQGVLDGIAALLKTVPNAGGERVGEVAHGTTVATNAILERRGARTALVTTEGFRDVFEIRRLRVPQLFNLFFEKPPTLIERFLRFEVAERVAATGEILKPLDEDSLGLLVDQLRRHQVASVAVCLLHSYAFPDHELRVGDYLRRHLPGVDVSLSVHVLRERKEYERTATTAVNAYVLPVMRGYLSALKDGLERQRIRATLQIMQSSGGLTPDEDAARRPVYILESGPAAGVLAARFIARHLGLPRVITFDMGGTTAKASMIEHGGISYSPEYEVGSSLSCSSRLVGGAGELIRVPTIDIAEVGAGGGSIAYLDRAGGLHVGPRSAGALPGPVCYRRGGTAPTLTDANAVLGYIRPGRLAEGDVDVDVEAARRAIHDQIARPLGLDLFEAAEGIHRIANAVTMRALREVSTQRGRDPRQYVLIAFGGSGPIQAAGLARELQVLKVIIPPLPGLFSAAGLLFSDVEHHDIRSCLLSGDSLRADAIEPIRREMQRAMRERFQREGYAPDRVVLSTSADVRYKGQFSEIRGPLDDAEITAQTLEHLRAAFEAEHHQLYGHSAAAESPIEVVSVRLIGSVPAETGRTALRPAPRAGDSPASRPVWFGARWGAVETPVVDRAAIGEHACGPLLIDEYDSTIVVPPDMTVTLDDQMDIIMEACRG